MRYNKLEKPYLIQRCKFHDGVDPKQVTISKFLKFDYMGAAEFEYGAIPHSIARISERIEQYQFIDIPEIQQFKTKFILTCWMDAENPENVGQYRKYLKILSNNDYRKEIHLKEWTHFDSHCIQDNKSASRPIGNYHLNIDIWYDIENDLFWSFDHRLLDLPKVMENTITYMKTGDGWEKTFNERHEW